MAIKRKAGLRERSQSVPKHTQMPLQESLIKVQRGITSNKSEATHSITLANTSEASNEDDFQLLPAAELDTDKKSFWQTLAERFFGDRISNEGAIHERIGRVKALALLSSDALSSVAYGTEASLAILVTAGVGFAAFNVWISLIIIILLAIVAFSYRQTIKHYPTGGGSYIVAKSHLNVNVGLVAAAALLLDYILTVSVSVSAGVDALTSAFTPLIHFGVPLGVLFIGIIMVINIRGVRDSGAIFAIPTYLFVVTFIITIIVGLVEAATSPGGLFTPLAEHVTNIQQTGNVSIILLLTAFASGCSAMTGTEAIADGVPIFRGTTPQEQSKNAAATLTIMALLLSILYGGTTYLAWRFGITPQLDSHPTLLAQIAQFIWHGQFGYIFFLLFQFSTTLILILAANTSFSDFPRLSSILARDDYMPHIFSLRGGRLAFNVGIVVLGVLSGLLLVIFQGHTESLINLYALGVFLAFTLSQSGMVMHWRKHLINGERERGWQRGMIISAFGALATGIVTIVIMISKAPRGAWVVILLIPLFVFMFRGIKRHYDDTRREIEEIQVPHADTAHLIIVPIASVDQLALQGLAYAWSITSHVKAVHVELEPGRQEHIDKIRSEWKQKVKVERFCKKIYLKPLVTVSANGQLHGTEQDHHTNNGQLNGNGQYHPDSNGASSTTDSLPYKLTYPELVIIDSPLRLLNRPLLKYIDKLLVDEGPQTFITVVLPELITNHWWERALHNQTAFRLKFALLSRQRVITCNVPYRHEH